MSLLASLKGRLSLPAIDSPLWRESPAARAGMAAPGPLLNPAWESLAAA